MGEAMRPAKLHALGEGVYDWSFFAYAIAAKA